MKETIKLINQQIKLAKKSGKNSIEIGKYSDKILDKLKKRGFIINAIYGDSEYENRTVGYTVSWN